MTGTEVNELKSISIEIEKAAKEIAKLRKSKRKYILTLKEKEASLDKQKDEAAKLIQEIDNSGIRQILTLKYIHLKSWDYISREMHYDRSTLQKRLKKFFN